MMSDVDAVTVRVDELELSAQQAFERIGRLEAASAEKPSLEERLGRAIKAVAALAKLKGSRWEDGEDIRLKGEVDAALKALDGEVE
jgi:hypothetical protein